MKTTTSGLLFCIVCLLQLRGAFSEDEDASVSREKRGLSMLRLGRAGRIHSRGIRMLRLGKRDSADNKLSPEEIKDLILTLLENENRQYERQAPIPRYGKDLSWQSEKRPYQDSMNLYGVDLGYGLRPVPRLGRLKRATNDVDAAAHNANGEGKERAVPMPRIGRETEDDESLDAKDGQHDRYNGDERAVPMPRIGRLIDGDEEDYPLYDELDKRGIGMLRLGRGMRMLRLGKRLQEDDKRSLALLRLGKRRMSMLRLGKREGDDDEVMSDKRSMRLLRLGKRRGVSMLRLGRSNSADDTYEDKRSLKLLRLG